MDNTAARVGLERGDLERYAAAHAFKCEELVAVDRTVIQDSRIAREHAYHKINQLDLFA